MSKIIQPHNIQKRNDNKLSLKPFRITVRIQICEAMKSGCRTVRQW
ncbi:hypothetical protein E2C01_089165 [Portunus trituberculatus]|uniref:Uncharacterized protein n=1 Tax=Portunus trituberculatus TaxID=210409 RepID=A0A5B7JHE9_PORTR|nr:hypothetical protein [Portunus trituberculatus]